MVILLSSAAAALAVRLATVLVRRHEGRPEGTRAQRLLPGQREVGAHRIGLVHQPSGLHPELQALVADVDGPEAVVVGELGPPELLHHLIAGEARLAAEACRAEVAVRAHGDADAREVHRQVVGDHSVSLHHQILGDPLGERVGGEAELAEHPELPQVRGDQRPEVAERDAGGLHGLAEGDHLLDRPIPHRLAGEVGVDIAVDVGAALREQAHHHVEDGRGDGFGRDRLHLASAGDGIGLLGGELAVLPAAHADVLIGAVEREGHVVDVVEGEEGARGGLEATLEVSHRDGSVERLAEADHGPGDDPPDPVIRGPTDGVEQSTVDAGGRDLADQATGDAAIRRLVVGVGDVAPHPTRTDGADVHDDDALGRERLEHAEDVGLDGVDDVGRLAGERGDVHAVDDGDRLELPSQAVHEHAVEHVDVVTDDVLDAREALQGLAAIDDHRVELGKADGQESHRTCVAHQTGTSQNQNGSFFQGNLLLTGLLTNTRSN